MEELNSFNRTFDHMYSVLIFPFLCSSVMKGSNIFIGINRIENMSNKDQPK